LVAGIFALSAKGSNSLFFLITYVPIILFWFLDSYYLQLERKYRKLYNTNTDKKSEEIDFKMTVFPSSLDDKTSYYQSLFSRTEFGFYIPLAILVAVVIIISIFA